MMTVPPQLTSSLPSFSYPASFRHPPPASSLDSLLCFISISTPSHGQFLAVLRHILCLPRSLPRSYLFDPAGGHLASAIAPNIAPGPRRAVTNSSKLWPLWKFRHFKLFEIEETVPLPLVPLVCMLACGPMMSNVPSGQVASASMPGIGHPVIPGCQSVCEIAWTTESLG